MNNFNNKTFRYVFIFLFTIVLLTAIASYFYYKSDNAFGPNLITAFVGVVLSAVATLVLLNGQTKDEEKKERNLGLYNAKLKVYSDFVSNMYEALDDNQITEDEMKKLRTKLFGEVSFYTQKNVLKSIEKELEAVKDYTDENMPKVFAGITSILQKDLREDDWPDSKDDVINLWGRFEQIIGNTNNSGETLETTCTSPTTEPANQTGSESIESKRLPQQAWHFIMWNDTQLNKLKEGFNELSLIEYGEFWRTNLVKQVGGNDIVMLFRRGANGYVGAYKVIGWRIFYFDKNKEELQIFKNEKLETITGEQYISDIQKYDIYESKDDGATTCANIIVEPLAFVENGVGNPGGVYRRTISRYDSHYAWLLKERFQQAGQWSE